MKVIKKTRLLPKPLVVSIDNVSFGADSSSVELSGTNLEGVQGRTESYGAILMPATVEFPDGTKEVVSLQLDAGTGNYAGPTQKQFAAGDRLTVSVTVDPAKPNYKAGVVSMTQVAN